MHPQLERLQLDTRRHFLKTCQLGIGATALSALLAKDAAAGPIVENPLAPKKPHFPAKAKRVIYLHLTGSPPHLDLYACRQGYARPTPSLAHLVDEPSA